MGRNKRNASVVRKNVVWSLGLFGAFLALASGTQSAVAQQVSDEKIAIEADVGFHEGIDGDDGRSPMGFYGPGWVDDGVNVRLESPTDRVGIGTSTPAANLEVRALTAHMRLTSDSTSRYSQGARLDFRNNGADKTILGQINFMNGVGELAPGAILYQDTAGKMIFRASTGTPSAMVLDSAGQLGIGTSSPQARLHVFGGENNGVTAPMIVASSNLAQRLLLDGNEIDAIADGLFLNNNTAQNVILVNGGGRVGIGTTNPGTFKFAVNGSAAKVGGGSWSSFSDERLKTNIKPMSGTLDRLMQLGGYEYEYTPEAVENKLALPGRQIGLLAQEVQEVFPDWVEADDEGYLFVTERATTALMVEALRDLRAEKDREIEDLRERIARLEAIIEALAEPTPKPRGIRER